MIHRCSQVAWLGVLMAAIVASGCHRPAGKTVGADAQETVVQVATARPERKALVVSTTQPGQIEAFEQTPLFAKVEGYVEAVLVDIGDPVTKGQLLVKLSVPELHDDLAEREALVAQADAEVKQAESMVQAAQAASDTAQAKVLESEAGILRAEAEHQRWKSEHERIKELAERGSVTRKLEDETLSQLRSAEAAMREVAAKVQSARAGFYQSQANIVRSRADLEAATARRQVAIATLGRSKTLLGYLEIKAPFDGVVTRRSVDTGHYVSPPGGADSKPLLTVARTDIVRIFVEVPELEAGQIDAGDEVMVRVQALEREPFDAKIVRSSWSLLESNHSLRTEIDVPNPQGVLRPGMYATVAIRLAERPDAIVVPMSAVIREGNATYCMLIASGKAQRTPIELGMRSGSEVEVISGLDVDDVVVVKLPETLKSGQPAAPAPPAN